MHPLEDLIYKKGFTIRKCAKTAGIDRTTLHKLFNGTTKKLRPDTIYIISEKLNEPYEKVVAISTEGL